VLIIDQKKMARLATNEACKGEDAVKVLLKLTLLFSFCLLEKRWLATGWFTPGVSRVARYYTVFLPDRILFSNISAGLPSLAFFACSSTLASDRFVTQ
jgi:hypothetical protein